MSLMDDILEQARNPGTFVEHGHFTLSRDKAIAKMAEYTLRHPKRYILEFVQAANFAGCNYIMIEVDSEEMAFAWSGTPPIPKNQLSDIFGYLFRKSNDPRTRHLYQLASGLNALLQSRPEELTIASGDGTPEGTHVLKINADRELTIGQRPDEQPLNATYIHARTKRHWLQRLLPGFGATLDVTEEEKLVAAYCRHTPVPIILNKDGLFGWKSRRAIRPGPGYQSFDDGKRRGALSLPTRHEYSPDGIDIVMGGVIITHTTIPSLTRTKEYQSLVGVICDDDLRKTADHADIVRDASWGAMLRAVQPIATQVHRRSLGPASKNYQPPPLPDYGTADEETTEEAPLPDPIAQLEPRPSLALEEVFALLGTGPVFYVQTDEARALAETAAPHRFPYPVLVLSESSATRLSGESKTGGVHRISTDQVAFLRHAMDPGRDRHTVRVEATLALTKLAGKLSITLTCAGERVAWASPGRGSLPFAIVSGGKAIWCSHLPITIPGIHAVLELSTGTLASDAPFRDEFEDALVSDLTPILHTEAWALVMQLTAEGATARSRAFIRTLLNDRTRAQIYRHEGLLGLDALYPSDWAPAADALRSAPLIDTPGEPVTLGRLMALQGTDEVIELPEKVDLSPIAALEERFGFGHIRHPSHRTPIAAYRYAPKDESEPVKIATLPGKNDDTPSAFTHLVWLSLERHPAPPPGWSTLGVALPHIGLARRDVSTSSDDRADIPKGLKAILSDRIGWIYAAAAREDSIYSPPTPRQWSAFRLAKLGIHDYLGSREEEYGNTPTQLRDILDDAPPRTLDEIRAAERLTRTPVPLAFDDPPHIWQSLADPDSTQWLVREAIAFGTVRGWIGIRIPYDPTGGLVLQNFRGLTLRSEPDPALPCHGLLTLESGRLRLTEPEEQLIRHAQLRLYASVIESLSLSTDTERQRATHRYSLHYIGPRLRKIDAHKTERATRLSQLSELLMIFHGGEAWGTLGQWTRADPDTRPALPAHVITPILDESKDPSDLEPTSLTEGNIALLMEILEEVMTNFGGSDWIASGKARILVRHSPWYGKRCTVRLEETIQGTVFALDPDTPLVAAALDTQSVEATLLLVLECCRVLRAKHPAAPELHTVHQFLNARPS